MYSVTSNHCNNHPSFSLSHWLITTQDYMAMSLMSRSHFPEQLEL